MGLGGICKRLWLRLQFWARRRERERSLWEEMNFHIDSMTEDLLKQGLPEGEARAASQRSMTRDLVNLEAMSEREARAAAHRKFGNMIRQSEASQAVWMAGGWIWLDRLSQDLRYALRTLRKNPGFTATAVLSLALGIGANTAIFSLIDALLLRWLPVPNAGRLLQARFVIEGKHQDSFSYPLVKALAERTDLFTAVCGFSGAGFLTGPPSALEQVNGARLSGGCHQTLGLSPVAGRLLTPDDDRPGAPPVAVISDGYWERKFNRDPGAIGKTILIRGQAVPIVGVTPRGFTGTDVGWIADVTLTWWAMVDPAQPGTLGAGNHYIRVIALPRPDLSRKELEARLKVVWPGLVPAGVPPSMPPKRRQAFLAPQIVLVPGSTGWSTMRGQYRSPLMLLMGFVGLVLLIACANIANLLLARASAREREIAVRMAIGAGRGRIIRQLLTESLLLASIGAAGGVLLARVGSERVLQLAVGTSSAALIDLSVNWRVCAFTLAISTATGLLFGLAPAFRATMAGAGPALKNDSRGAGGAGSRFAAALVVTQVAISLVLVAGAGLFLRTLRNLELIDPGFRHEGVLISGLNTSGSGISQKDPRLPGFQQELIDSVGRIPGVRNVAMSSSTPLSGGFASDRVSINGQPPQSEEDGAHFYFVSPGFFATMRIPLQAGRDFTTRDDLKAPGALIVNQAFVRRYFPAGYPLGQHVSVPGSKAIPDLTIVGVVKDSVSFSLRAPPPPVMYMPLFQVEKQNVMLEVYAEGSLSVIGREVEQTLRQRLSGVIIRVQGLTPQIEAAVRLERLLATLAAFFGGLALLLSAVGLYGLQVYVVTRRTGEIGIRMALGAPQREMLLMVLRDALKLAGVGIVIGVPIVLWSSRFVSSMMFGLQASDPSTIGIAAAILAGVALMAGLLPARRASRVDPMVALRYE